VNQPGVPPERLQKYLARGGALSRRAAERLIAVGRVRVNGTVVERPGTLVSEGTDRVEIDGRTIAPAGAPTTVALHKPRGVVSTVADPEGRRTVVELVPSSKRLYPVGRLDYDSEGLLLLTDDGDLAFRVTHPRHGVEKEYHVLVRGSIRDSVLERLRSGLPLDGERVVPAHVTLLGQERGGTWLRFVLHQGRNRQIRRMAEVVQVEILRLIRTRIDGLVLDRLAPGAWRRLRGDEVARLRGLPA